MKPLTKLGEKALENGSVWELWERDGVLTLQLDGMPCANSFTYGSEEAMAELATSPITRAGQPCIMIAGLGLGYGLAKAMQCLPKEKARFIVAEPVAEIVKWNREFGENKALWEDKRVSTEPATAAELCRKRTGSLHAIREMLAGNRAGQQHCITAESTPTWPMGLPLVAMPASSCCPALPTRLFCSSSASLLDSMCADFL